MKLRYLYIWLIGLMAIGCFDDDTTVDTVRISKVSIDTASLQKVYDRDKNETLVIDITQYVTQAEKDLPLTFQWDMDYKFFSDSSVLVVDCQTLGSFPMRVKVSNEQSSAFYEFQLNINTPYEEGLAVLSVTNDGTGMLSFMRYLSDGTSGEFETHCLKTNNPGEEFPKYPTDIRKRESQLFISYKQDPSIYIVNDKTLELENIVSASEYPGFVPECMLLPENAARTAIIISSDGAAYNLASLEGIVLTHTSLRSSYSTIYYGYYGAYQSYDFLWDEKTHSMVSYDGYTVTDANATGFGSVWEGEHEVVAMVEDKEGESITVLTELNGEIWKTSLGYYILKYNWDTWMPEGIDYYDEQRVIANPSNFKQGDPYVGSSRYQCMFYAQGNKIYRWYYSSTSFPSDAWGTLDLGDAEITTMTVSPDGNNLYVGAYRPNEAGENGYIYIYDIRNGNLIKSCKNVAYKPVKIMYKKK